MKKVLVLCVSIVMLVCCFAACNKTEKPLPYEANISIAETEVFVGANDNFNVTLTSGIFEKNLKMDGLVGATEQCTKLNVLPINLAFMNKIYTFTVTGDKSSVSGSLTKDIFGNGFVANIKNISEVGAIQSVAILSGAEINETLSVASKMENLITYKKALEIACAQFKTEIEAEANGGKLEREIVIKFINDASDVSSEYYWYVSFVKGDNDYWCLLINPTTSEVLTKKV